MIGIVVVSHSRPLAEAAVALAVEMVPAERRPRVLTAAGLDETTFGTDAAAIAEAIAQADDGHGVLVLLDLGSAVLSAEMALEFGDSDAQVRISPAPLVEGLVAAVVTAGTGADLATCDAEARRGLDAKLTHLGATPGPAHAADSATPSRERNGAELTWSTTLDLPSGLHARPAAAVVAALAGLQVEATARNASRPELGDCDADSAMGLLTLGVQAGDSLELTLTGPDAHQAAAALDKLAADHFGE